MVEINSTTKSGFLHYNLIHCFFHLTPLEVNFSHPLGSTVTPMMSSSNMMSMLSLDLSTYWSTSSFSSADRTGQIRLSTPSPISHSGPKLQSKNIQVRLISFKQTLRELQAITTSNSSSESSLSLTVLLLVFDQIIDKLGDYPLLDNFQCVKFLSSFLA